MKRGAKSVSPRQTLRAVLTTGEVRMITVVRGANGWAEESFEGHHDTPRDAALGYAIGFGLPVAELRAEGEQTTAEQVAAAVAKETQRCEAVCRSIASRLPAAWGADAAAGCADAIIIPEPRGDA